MSANGKKKEVFISYHMNSSTDIVEKISAALDGVGISSWYAKKDIEGAYASAVIEAIESCRVFLLILNEHSSSSAHCLNEINAVFERLNKKEDVVILPFKIDKCELSRDAYYYLGRIRMFDGSLPPEMERVAELVERIEHILGKEAVVEKWISEGETAQKRYRMVGTAVSANSSFVGRREELAMIHEKLSANPHKLIMVGMGGIGKSEIAKAYCDAYRSDYDIVLWVSFDTSILKTVINDFAFPIKGIDRADYAEEDERTYFMRKLKVLREIADERVLIVLDNFDVMEDEDLDVFCSGRYSVLFTSRYHEVCGDVPEMEIRPITDPDELMGLFRTEYSRKLEEDGVRKVRELLALLDGHPLSIRLVASAMESNRIQPEKMLEIIRSGNEASEKRSRKAVEKIRDRLQQLFTISSLSVEEQAVLKNLVLLPLGGVEVETFYDWCDFDDFDVIDALVQKSWVVHNKAEDTVHLHPIVKDVMSAELEKDPDCCVKLIESLVGGIQEMLMYPFKEKKRYYECFSSAADNIPSTHPLRWNVRYGNARMIMEMSRYDEAREKMIPLLEETEELEKRLDLLNRISHSFCLNGCAEEGIVWAEKGLALLDGMDVPQLTIEQRRLRRLLYTRLNDAHRTLGNFKNCENYMRKMLEETERFPDEDTNTIAWLCLHLGRVLALQENEQAYEESTRLMERCYTLFSELGNIGGVGYAYMFHGMLHMYEGKYEQAFEKTARATEILEGVLGQQHVDMAKLKLFEANIHRAKGDEAAARSAYLQAEEMMVQRGNPGLARKIRDVMDSGKVGYTN